MATNFSEPGIGLQSPALAGSRQVGGYRLDCWLDSKSLAGVEYASYWNDEGVEAAKPWNVLDGDFQKLERHLESIGLPADLKDCVRLLEREFGVVLQGTGIDIAAGSCWAARHLLDLVPPGRLEKLYCLDFSLHRLGKLAPHVLAHYSVPPEKVALIVGNIYEIRLPDAALDFVLMSQAFHHADDPERLLREVHRVLKPRGCVVIIGEHIVRPARKYVKHAVKFGISRACPRRLQKKIFGGPLQVRSLLPSLRELLAPDPVTGDHYYTDREYDQMLARGFEMRRVKRKQSSMQSFVLVKS